MKPITVKAPLIAIFLACLFIFPPQQGSATHIVGGEMTYKCLGNDIYELSLTVYRDCFFGDPLAWFDNPASIGIFDVDNSLLFAINVPYSGENDTLDAFFLDPCLFVPGDVCVHTTTYTTRVTLPFKSGGYQIIYQRCCRNETIQNIFDPLEAGMTNSIRITEVALNECNSSPKITNWPPVFVCVDKELKVSQGAIDEDGDSIAYKFCTPLIGGSLADPRPQPPTNPPYPEVQWKPPYGLNNLIGANPKGTFDVNTGFISGGIPRILGQFIVAICVEEYRDGKLLSTTRRDFQFNVGNCGESFALFFVPDIQCDNLTVEFDNQSDLISGQEWYFGGFDNIVGTSNLENPTFTFPDTGVWETCLVTDGMGSCSDTFCRTFVLQTTNVVPDFDFSILSCQDSLFIQVLDKSTDSVYLIDDYLWEVFSGTTLLDTSTVQNPNFVITVDDSLRISLTIFSTNGCGDTLNLEVDASIIVDELFPDSLTICRGDCVNLNPNFTGPFTFTWSPNEGLDDPDAINPLACPEETTNYSVLISSVDNECEVVIDILVIVEDAFDLPLPDDTVTCDGKMLLDASLNIPNTTYHWSNYPDFSDTIALTSDICLFPDSAQWYYIMVQTPDRCKETDSVFVINGQADISIQTDAMICLGDTALLCAVNNLVGQTLTYIWNPHPTIFSDLETDCVSAYPTEVGTYTYSVEGTNQYGCTARDTVEITVLDDIGMDNISYVQDCEILELCFENESGIAEYFTWYFNWPDQDASSSEINPCFEYPAGGVYTVALIPDDDIPCDQDTLFFEVEVFEPLIEVDFDWDLISCDSIAVVQFNDLTIVHQAPIVSWSWTFSDGQSSNLQNPIVSFEDGPVIVDLMVTTADDCTNMTSMMIDIMPIDENVISMGIRCPDTSPIALNPGGDPDAVYQWDPNEDLDLTNPENPLALPDETTTYSVTITSADGLCSVVKSATIFVSPLIGLDCGVADPDTINLSQESQLEVPLIPGVSYSWTPAGSLMGPNTNNPIASPEETTTYILTMTDEYGCTLTCGVTVTVRDNPCEEPHIFVPNAFSPNGDGENDVFYVLGNTIEEMELHIYNRWGEKIFTSNSQSVGWDGTYNGKELSNDVFGYYLRVGCFGGSEFFKKGNVTLLR